MSEARGVHGHSGPWVQFLARAARLLRAASDRLFRKDDAQASQNGWQIQVRQAGWSRTYRDPRFDVLAGGPAGRRFQVMYPGGDGPGAAGRPPEWDTAEPPRWDAGGPR